MPKRVKFQFDENSKADIDKLRAAGVPVLEIEMNRSMRPELPCYVCGTNCSDANCGIPTFNGDVVSNDWRGEWFSKPVCENCWHFHAEGSMPVCDKLYEHLLREFIGGDGI